MTTNEFKIGDKVQTKYKYDVNYIYEILSICDDKAFVKYYNGDKKERAATIHLYGIEKVPEKMPEKQTDPTPETPPSKEIKVGDRVKYNNTYDGTIYNVSAMHAGLVFLSYKNKNGTEKACASYVSDMVKVPKEKKTINEVRWANVYHNDSAGYYFSGNHFVSKEEAKRYGDNAKDQVKITLEYEYEVE